MTVEPAGEALMGELQEIGATMTEPNGWRLAGSDGQEIVDAFNARACPTDESPPAPAAPAGAGTRPSETPMTAIRKGLDALYDRRRRARRAAA